MDDKLYVVVGSLVVANIGTIISVVYTMIKLVYAAGQFKASTETRLNEHEKDINAAHAKIRDINQHLLGVGENGTKN